MPNITDRKSTATRGRKPVDLTGEHFGRLTVVRYEGRNHRHRFWKCRCDCGGITVSRGDALASGLSKSCGCLNREIVSRSATKHGQAWPKCTPEYRAWAAILQRCFNHKSRAYRNYGARGIVVCDRWRESFDAFFSDVGNRPSKAHSLDRYPNNNGNYEPGNVRWATKRQQSQNTRATRNVTLEGLSLCITEWARRLGIAPNTLRYRVKAGWDIHRILNTPGRSLAD
jgi:hypothetical protein